MPLTHVRIRSFLLQQGLHASKIINHNNIHSSFNYKRAHIVTQTIRLRRKTKKQFFPNLPKVRSVTTGFVSLSIPIVHVVYFC